MINFICNWDTTVIVLTVIVVILMLFASVKSILSLIKYYKSESKNQLLVLSFSVLSFLPLLILVFMLFYMPVEVSVKDKDIYIRQVKGGITIPVSNIIEIRRYTEADGKNSVRTFASGGLFGYLGKFENPQIGKFLQFATDSQNRMLIRTETNVYVISCKDPDLFIQTVQSRIK